MENIQSIISLILRAVALAMGVVVVVLSILGEVSVESSITMLGIGLLTLAIDSLSKSREEA
jgi:hypothetical protein